MTSYGVWNARSLASHQVFSVSAGCLSLQVITPRSLLMAED